MNRNWGKRYLIFALLWMFFPLQVKAADQDAVTLRQEEERVAVLLEMSNAQNEKITSVSISLELNSDCRDKVRVEFEFAPELAGVAQGFQYSSDTGRMDIYVGSSESLFTGNDEVLRLGYVRVMPEDAAQVLDIELSYCENSFRTANVSYGDRIPMLTQKVESVCMQVGAGVVYTASTQTLEEYLAQALLCSRESYSEAGWNSLQDAIRKAQELLKKSGLMQDEINAMAESLYQMMVNTEMAPPDNASASETGKNTESSSGKGEDHQSEGLYDENTRFVNDPANAQNISSTVIRESGFHPELVDMSQGTAAAMGGRVSSGSSAGSGGQIQTAAQNGALEAAGQIRAAGKVSVVDPEDGPASILVGGSGSWNLSGGEGLSSLTHEDAEGSGEIMLDQKNGGVADEGEQKERNIPLIAAVSAAVIVAVTAAIIIPFTAVKKGKPAGKKRRRKKK